MSKKNPDKNILIVTNSADELRAVRELMTDELGGYWSADNETAGLRLFEEHHPSVLLLAFDDIDNAQSFYLTLYRQNRQIQDIPHQSLLLCKNTESEKAYALCQSGTIDDYVVNRPLYDPFRLRLSVQHALKRRLLSQQSNTQYRQLANVGSDVRQLDHYVGKELAGVQVQQQNSLSAFQRMTSKLMSQLDSFEERLRDPAMDGVVKVIDPAALRLQFDQLRQKSIELEARAVEDKLYRAGESIKEFGDGFRQCVEPIQLNSLPPALPEVMVVDDDELYREMLLTIFEDAGMRAIAVEDGEAALSKLRFRRPDLILMDYQMPGLDGIATLRRLKADLNLKAVPVVMLTGDSERTVVERCIRSGAAGFVVKPSTPSIILAKVNSLLASTPPQPA